MNWLQRLKLRWMLRGSPGTPLGPLPGVQQQEQKTADQKYKEQKGFSAATTPMPWGEDISAHNKALDQEYEAEIARRKVAYTKGEYQPRFLKIGAGEMTDARMEAIVAKGAKPTVDEIEWSLEMTITRGRRVDVTEGIGVPVQHIPTPVEFNEARIAGQLGREVAALEGGANLVAKTPREFIGSRASILKAVGGNEAMADQVEASARKMFGVEDLDAPMVKTDA